MSLSMRVGLVLGGDEEDKIVSLSMRIELVFSGDEENDGIQIL